VNIIGRVESKSSLGLSFLLLLDLFEFCWVWFLALVSFEILSLVIESTGSTCNLILRTCLEDMLLDLIAITHFELTEVAVTALEFVVINLLILKVFLAMYTLDPS
jgi:hypothetical protein